VNEAALEAVEERPPRQRAGEEIVLVGGEHCRADSRGAGARGVGGEALLELAPVAVRQHGRHLCRAVHEQRDRAGHKQG
jgi:hypothetical protein